MEAKSNFRGLKKQLEATFEACLGLFGQNMKTWGRDSRRSGVCRPGNRAAVWGAPGHFQRCTRHSHSSKSNMGLRKMYEPGPPQSACRTVLRLQAIWSWSGKKTSFFGKWRWLEHRRMDRAIHWFLYNKFNLDLVDTLRAFKAAPCLVCPATAPLLNPTPASTDSLAATAADIPLSQWGPSSWMACARSCQPMAYLARAEGVSFKADTMEDLAAKKVDLGRNRKRIDNLPIGQVQSRWFFSSISNLRSSSAAAEWVLLTTSRLVRSAGAAFTIMWRPPWCFTATIAETITLMWSS